MLKKKLVYISSLIFIIVFIILLCITNYQLTKVDKSEVKKHIDNLKNVIKTNQDIENEIRLRYLSLKVKRKIINFHDDQIIHTFLKNVNSLNRSNKNDLDGLWKQANDWLSKDRFYDVNDNNLGNVIYNLKNAKITYANVYSRGTQLKLLFSLEGEQKVVFKPQWYPKEALINGNVYAGNDRYEAEILAFYLSGILNLPLVPVTTERIINITGELFPVASKTLLSTSFQKEDNISCIYGKCFYCTKDKPVCETSRGKMHGAIIFYVNGKFNSYRSPWQRTYQKGKKGLWEYEENFCQRVKQQLNRNILLDLIDTAIFDYLLQNGDRHHYETINDKVILIDNGKGLRNPNINYLDILAPLYQCCMLRTKMLETLKSVYRYNIASILKAIPEVAKIVAVQQLNAIEDRMKYVFATIERCSKENKLLLY